MYALGNLKRKNSKTTTSLELDAELVKLTALVRERRKELERLKECPNKTCQCRQVWNEQVGKTMASQVRKIRRKIRDVKVT